MIFDAIRRSVRAKLLVLMLSTTMVALAVAIAALVIYDLRTYHDRWVADLMTQAEILGRSAFPALAFDDPRAARETLALLKVRPEILAAAIYDEQGRVFASYARDANPDEQVPQQPVRGSPRVEGNAIMLFRDIVENRRAQGTVYIKARYELSERLEDYLGIAVVVIALSMLAALLMSARLQRTITGPIAETALVAQQVMESRDFSLRVRKTTEDEIGSLVDAFNNMLAEIGRRSEALLRADRMKDEFLATLAHELRNPLAPISNALHLLEAVGSNPEVAASARAMMARQLKQLVRLVDDLLDVSRITTGKLMLHTARIELHKVIDNAVEIARPLIESRRHAFTVRLPQEAIGLDGDETRLAQVFSNLLNNAARYTDAGGRIELTAQTRDERVEVHVVDNGMGIPADILPEIFRMFTQANTSLERAQAGLGVGLALARYLVEMHGGTIEAFSEGAGRGSRFTVSLPLAAPASTAAAAPALVPDTATSRSRILVVDDNQDFATSLAMILRDMGNDVRVEHDGGAGLRAAETFQPAVAFLDIGLPDMTGYDLARRLREHRAGPPLVLIAVTGWGQDSDKQRAAQAGFDFHLVKPIDPAQLPSLLDAAERRRDTAAREA